MLSYQFRCCRDGERRDAVKLSKTTKQFNMVAQNQNLMVEAAKFSDVWRIIQFHGDGSPATTPRWRAQILNDSSCSSHQVVGTEESGDCHSLPDFPKNLHCHACVGFCVTPQDERCWLGSKAS